MKQPAPVRYMNDQHNIHVFFPAASFIVHISLLLDQTKGKFHLWHSCHFCVT